MTTKMREMVTLVLSDTDVRRLLTASICTSFSAFEHQHVARVYQAEGYQFVVELLPDQPAKLATVPGGKVAAK